MKLRSKICDVLHATADGVLVPVNIGPGETHVHVLARLVALLLLATVTHQPRD